MRASKKSGCVAWIAWMCQCGQAAWIIGSVSGCGQGVPESPRVEHYDHKTDTLEPNLKGSQAGNRVEIEAISAILREVDGWDAIEVSTWKDGTNTAWRLSPASSAKIRSLLTREARAFKPSKTPVKFEAKSHLRIGDTSLEVFGACISGRIGAEEYVWASTDIATFAEYLTGTDAKHVQARVQEYLDSLGATETGTGIAK